MRPLALFLLAQATFSCSMTPGFVFATFELQAENAGIIVVGDVKRVYGDQFSKSIEIENAIYHKGCGPKSITIGGFKGSSLCGKNAPNKGTRAIFFTCVNEPNMDSVLKLNSFHPFVGYVDFDEENKQKLAAIYRPRICFTGQVASLACKNKKPEQKPLPEVKLTVVNLEIPPIPPVLGTIEKKLEIAPQQTIEVKEDVKFRSKAFLGAGKA